MAEGEVGIVLTLTSSSSSVTLPVLRPGAQSGEEGRGDQGGGGQGQEGGHTECLGQGGPRHSGRQQGAPCSSLF